MKAIIWTKYGSPDVLQLQEVEKPAPKSKEILIKVAAATVTAGDCEFRRIKFPFWIAVPLRAYVGFRKPTRITILGQEVAGVVEAIGSKVTKFKVGDPVFGGTEFNFGAYAEYVSLPEDGVLAIKPENMNFQEAATLTTGGLESLHFLGKAKIQAGETILINGAGGSIGTYGLQLAKHYGAEVTAVDHGDKLEMLRSIGADYVIDYTQEDFTKNGKTYDVIFDVVGKSHFSRSLKALNENGRYIIANPTLLKGLRGAIASARTDKQVILELNEQTVNGVQRLKELAEAGVLKSVIDRTFSLEQTSDAHRYVETGAKAGNVVIVVDDTL